MGSWGGVEMSEPAKSILYRRGSRVRRARARRRAIAFPAPGAPGDCISTAGIARRLHFRRRARPAIAFPPQRSRGEFRLAGTK